MPKRTKKSLKPDVPLGFSTVDDRWKHACQGIPLAIPHSDPAFDAALRIRNGDELVHFELEARVLADQSRDEIAAKMSIPCDTVAAYEHWFFAAREHLTVTGWIEREAIRRRPTGVLEREDLGPFWRWIGFTHGLFVLESLLRAVDRNTLKLTGIDAYLEDDVPLDPHFKLLILIERMPVPKTSRQWEQLLRCQQVLSLPVVAKAEDLLTPLTMTCLPFSEPVTSVQTENQPDKNSAEVEFEHRLERHLDLMIESAFVVQAQAA